MARNLVTLSGMVGRDPDHRVAGTGEVTNFSIAVTDRVKDSDGQWSDGPTTWYSVEAWNVLGVNAAASIRKGQPLVVHGELWFRDYPTRDGGQGREARIRAHTIGHDMSRGISTFQRVARQAAPPSAQLPPAPTTTPPAPAADRSGEWAAPGLSAAPPALAAPGAAASASFSGTAVAMLEQSVDDDYDEPPF